MTSNHERKSRRVAPVSEGKSKSAEQELPSTGIRLFETLVEAFRETDPRVERVKLFGFDCLRIAGKVFTKVHKGRLVMKLPAPRIASLMMAGHLEPYDGKRGGMKEWAVVDTADEQLVVALSEESRSFVGG